MTPEQQLIVLQEEKAYWQKETMILREIRESQAAVIRKVREELNSLEHQNFNRGLRLKLIEDIQRTMVRTGAPLPDLLMGGVTAECLEECLVAAQKYQKPEAEEAHGMVLTAWLNNGNFYRHVDTRPGKAVKLAETSKGKIALYAKVAK